MSFDIVFVPHLSLIAITLFAIMCFAAVLASFILRASGTIWRAAAFAGALLVLANPAILEEERAGLPDVAVIVADQTQSQAIGDRSKTVTDTVEALRARLAEKKDLDVRVVTVTEARGSAGDGGTALFGPLAETLADVPPDRIAGAILVTDGQVHDLAGADHFLPLMKAGILLADKAFDADARVRAPLQAAGKTAVIPPKANRRLPSDFDRDIYKARHLIENFFAKLKQFRAIATRYDKTARNFRAAIYLAAAVIWLN